MRSRPLTRSSKSLALPYICSLLVTYHCSVADRRANSTSIEAKPIETVGLSCLQVSSKAGVARDEHVAHQASKSNLKSPPQEVKNLQSARLGGDLSNRRELPVVHFVYTTGCNDYQLIHSVMLDFTWRAVGSQGRLTRLVSSCASDAARELLTRSPLQGSPNYSVFIAEGEFDHYKSGELYPARARPHTIKQWIEKEGVPKEPVIALIDPDFVFLKPLSAFPRLANVREGNMVTSSHWSGPVDRKYQSGPVWLMSSNDMQKIVPLWIRFTDENEGYEGSSKLMREQYAFMQAAASLQIPAEKDDTLTYDFPAEQNHLAMMYAIHYFSSYNYQKWEFHKALTSTGWYADHFSNTVPAPIACGAPLLQVPPPADESAEIGAQVISKLLPAMNSAFLAYRQKYCPGEAEAFASRGVAAFGLMRTMQPIACPGVRAGEFTRFRVEPDEIASWDGEWKVLGGGSDRCAKAAQQAEFTPL